MTITVEAIVLMIRTALAATAIVFLVTGDTLPPTASGPAQPLSPPTAAAADADGPREPDGRPEPTTQDDRPGTSPQGRAALAALPGFGAVDTTDRGRDADVAAGRGDRSDAADERGEAADRGPSASEHAVPDAAPHDLTDQPRADDPVDDQRLAAQPARSDDEVVVGELDVSPGQGPSNDLRLAPSTTGGVQVQQGASDLKAGPGCSVQCITGGVLYARGVGVQLVVTTDTYADIWLNVHRPGFADVHQSPNPTTVLSTLHLDLEPGTEYEVLVAATDSEGHTSYATGSFTTLRRHAVVSFSQANLVSSPVTNSIDAFIRVDGSWLEPGPQIPYEGSYVGLGIHSIQLDDVDQKLDLLFQLAQSGVGGKLGEGHDLPKPGGGGTSGTWYYNSTATFPIDLDVRPADATSWIEHTLELVLGSSPTPLEFEVPVTIHVTYS